MGMGWLRERLLQQTETVEEFNGLLKTRHCADMHKCSKSWEQEYYSRAKAAIAADGDGLGRLTGKFWRNSHCNRKSYPQARRFFIQRIVDKSACG